MAITPSPKTGAWHSPTGSKKQNNRRKLSDLQQMPASASILIKNLTQGGFWLRYFGEAGTVGRGWQPVVLLGCLRHTGTKMCEP